MAFKNQSVNPSHCAKSDKTNTISSTVLGEYNLYQDQPKIFLPAVKRHGYQVVFCVYFVGGGAKYLFLHRMPMPPCIFAATFVCHSLCSRLRDSLRRTSYNLTLFFHNAGTAHLYVDDLKG